MRDAFLDKLTELAEKDDSVVFLTADLGFGVFEDFEKRFPKQYVNVGVAEQNMTGLATGLALEGRKVVTYSIGNFPTLRCLEQIRNDACYHEANVTIVASGGGFSYGALGMSHHATEDLAILRALPGVTVVAPSSAWEASEATEALINSNSVGYLRLDKTKDSSPPKPNEIFKLGKARRIREGADLTLIASGGIVADAISAAEKVSLAGIDCRVLSCHSLKPIDVEEIRSAANETQGIITIEEHNIIGGLAGAVSETCMVNGVYPKSFKRIGLDDHYSSIVGSQSFLKAKYGMDSDAIISSIHEMIGK